MNDTATIDSPEIPPPTYRVRSIIQPYDEVLRNFLDTNGSNYLFPQRFPFPNTRIEHWVRVTRPQRFRRLLDFLSDAPVIPASKILHFMFRYERDENDENDPPDDLALPDIVGNPQWDTAMGGIGYAWKMCQLTSTGLIASVLAVLQIQPIFDSITARTFIMASVMFSCSSLVSSCLYIASKESFMKRRVIDQWKAAAEPTDEFWLLVSLPAAFIIWSSASFSVTLLLLVWNTFEMTAMGRNESNSTASAIFLTLIPFVCFTRTYYAMKKIRGL